MTDGPILEVGGGLFSTPFLHWDCFPQKRELVTYENSPEWFNILRKYRTDFHNIILVDSWDDMPIERYWEIAFIDHAPAERRKVEIARLANFARYIIVHDSDKRTETLYGLEEIYPLFKYRYDYTGAKPNTVILSNFIDLNKLQWIQQ